MKRQPKPAAIVTREYIVAQIKILGASVVIGRALAAIYRRQTTEEQQHHTTALLNGVGFTGFDAKIGSRCAEHFIATGQLLPWMVRVWSVPDKHGFPKVCKYVRQLNEIAYGRRRAKENCGQLSIS